MPDEFKPLSLVQQLKAALEDVTSRTHVIRVKRHDGSNSRHARARDLDRDLYWSTRTTGR